MSNILRIVSSFLILVILQACIILTPTVIPDQQGNNIPATETQEPFVAETDGPPGFSATLSTPDIVLLTWETVPDAVGYKVQIVFAGLEPLTIVYLPQESTSFEHILSPESSLLTYRLQTITSSGTGGASSLQIATQRHEPNPLTVQAAFSENGIVSAVIGPAGGTLETTDDRGVIYTLAIPPTALDTELEITMTPVSTIDGWPLDGDFLGAVRLEPEGWLLNEVAYLTIRMPDAPSPDLSTVGIAFTGSGEEFHLTPAYIDPASIASLGTGGARQGNPVLPQEIKVIRLPVMELRTSGVGEASSDSAAAMAEEHAPTNSNDAADQKAAATEVVLDDLTPLLSNAELAEIATTNLLTQILNDITDCNDFKRAVGSFGAWESKVAGLGDTSGFRETIMEQLAEKAVETIEKASEDCAKADKGVVPASVPCAEKLTGDIQSASNPFYTELQKKITNDPDLKKRFTEADDASEQCPHSYGVNEAASLGYQWTGACIPTLERSYQLVWIGNGIRGTYRFYPSDPFSGRVEGDGLVDATPGVTTTLVYDGTYEIEVTKTDTLGNPEELNATLIMEVTHIQCIDGASCITSIFNSDQEIPLLVHEKRCSMP